MLALCLAGCDNNVSPSPGESVPPSPESSTEASSGLSNVSQDFKISLIDYHPGVPGYDVTYDITATFKGTLLHRDDYNLEANLDGVTLSGNKITVPDEMRQTGQVLSITGTYLKDENQTDRIDIELRAWTLTFEDNFDTLDPDIWSTFEPGLRRPDSPHVLVADEMSYIRNGELMLEVKKLDGTEIGAGAISTSGNFSQIYGCFTAKIKMPEKGGILSAFWLMPQGRYMHDGFFTISDGVYEMLCSEIDIVEHWATSGSKTLHSGHFWNVLNQDYRGAPLQSWYDIPDFVPGNYYEYTSIWTRNALYFYVDGILVAAHQGLRSVDSVPAYILFSVHPAPDRKLENEMINGVLANYNGWFGFMMDDDYPQTMNVEFLRVYK
jgi:hypothetical protein